MVSAAATVRFAMASNRRRQPIGRSRNTQRRNDLGVAVVDRSGDGVQPDLEFLAHTGPPVRGASEFGFQRRRARDGGR